MARLAPQAKSPAGKPFRDLRSRLLGARGGKPSAPRIALAEHAAWAGAHVMTLNEELAAAIAERRAVSAGALEIYARVSPVYAAALRDLDATHEMRPAIAPLHRADVEPAT